MVKDDLINIELVYAERGGEMPVINSDDPPKAKAMRRILVVDDHPIVRRGLAELISQEAGLCVCGEAGTAKDGLATLKATQPDAVIVDVGLEDSSGIELTRQIRALYPDLPVLVLSMHEEALYAERALKAGANGYVMKLEASETLLKGIKAVLNGELYLSEKIAARLLKGFVGSGQDGEARFGVESLTDRELEVFDMIGKGLSTREVAGRLNLSIKTVETHRTHIKSKLRLRNSTELTQHAASWVNNGGRV
jgi:DNA-binding NarL/FixJ family response regulator